MESVISYFSSLGIDLHAYATLAAILLLGALLFSALCRFIFRKQTLLGHTISSAIAIIFIYLLMVLILTVATDLHFLVTPLPFVSISDSAISFFSFTTAGYNAIAPQLLSMILLAFLVNLADTVIPSGKNILLWFFWRIITVVIGFLLHYLTATLFNSYLPQAILLYAPMILLVILLIMLLTGALRFLVGLLLTTVNPLIAALYTFFFATLVGKQITKSVLTTAILCCVVLIMEKIGVTELSLMPGALLAYIPFLLLLIVVWRIVKRK